jgi:Cysteine-rich secretory protein family
MLISTRARRTAPRAGGGHGRRPGPLDARRPRPLRAKRLALLVAAPLLVLGLAACEPNPEQESVRSHVNASRQASGLGPLGDDVAVRLKAQAWAEHLASKGRLSHSSLSSGLDVVPWVAVAENVGYGSSIGNVHDQFMASSKHRSNILDSRWDRIGTGHAVGSDGRVYVVQVFVDVG